MKIKNNIFYIGVNDKRIDLFEGMYKVEKGMSYNSYLIIDSKIAVIDSVDRGFEEQWLENIERALPNNRTPDYLVVHHMEPDHSACILAFMKKYPNAVVVSSDKAFRMMKNFYNDDFSSRRVVVKEGDVLELGERNLQFISAPMVHWPEVMMSYVQSDKLLFSADAFGKFGALDCDEDWACEARRYYFGIVGKFGAPVQVLLRKVSSLEIGCICPLHGPVLSENINYYLGLYNTWSKYEVETDGVLIAYTSVYGNTKSGVAYLEKLLLERGCPNLSVMDLARCDMAEAVEDAFRYSKLVLATTTYNGGVFPFMRTFIESLTERNYSNRDVYLIENGSWAPMACKVMKNMLEGSKNINIRSTVTILGGLNDESTLALESLAKEIW